MNIFPLKNHLLRIVFLLTLATTFSLIITSCACSKKENQTSNIDDSLNIKDEINKLDSMVNATRELIPITVGAPHIHKLILIDNLDVKIDADGNFQVKYDFEIGSTDGFSHNYILFVITNGNIVQRLKISDKVETYSFQIESTDAVSFVFQGFIVGHDENGEEQKQITSVSSSYILSTNNASVNKQKIVPIQFSETLKGEMDKTTIKMLK